MHWQPLLFVLGAIFLAWFLFHSIKRSPQTFSKQAMGKSFYTLGILALLLIALIAFCVMLLRHG